MGKIKLTESDLIRIVERVIKEEGVGGDIRIGLISGLRNALPGHIKDVIEKDEFLEDWGVQSGKLHVKVQFIYSHITFRYTLTFNMVNGGIAVLHDYEIKHKSSPLKLDAAAQSNIDELKKLGVVRKWKKYPLNTKDPNIITRIYEDFMKLYKGFQNVDYKQRTVYKKLQDSKIP